MTVHLSGSRPEQIKDMIHREKFEPVRFVGKGDCAYKVAYLVKKDYLYVYGRNMNVYQESYVK